jgi:RNA polymerase sigma factor (sigma-70 family)
MGTNGHASQSEWVSSTLQRFEQPLVRYAQRITGDLETAREVVQDTFLRLCRQQQAAIDGHLSQWLFTVCRNRALDVQQKERRMSTTLDFDQQSGPAATLATAAPDEAAETRDSAARVLEFLDQLPTNQQEVIRLKFQNELSYREIAEVTGLTVSNVGFLLHVGLKELRKLMKEP